MKVLNIFALILFFASAALAELNFPAPVGFINDFAGILNSQQKQELESVCAGLKQNTGAEMAIAIVKSVEPLDSKLYAVKLFEKWKIGEKGKDNGILLLLALEEKRIEVEVGYGLEGTVPDALAGRILDAYAVPYFKKGEFGEGIIQTAKALSKTIKGEEIALSPAKKSRTQGESSYLIYIILGVIILGLLFRKGGSVVMGIFGAIWGLGEAGIVGALVGALVGFFFGFLGIYSVGGGGGFGSGGFGGFGGGGSGGGGSGRSW